MLGAGHTGAQPSQAATVPLAGARRERLLAWTKRQASALRPRPRSGRAKVERCRAGGRTPRAGVPESSAGGSRRCNRRADRGVAPQLARAGAAAADRSLPAGRQPARCAAARRSARQRESAGYAAAFALTDAEGGGKFPNLKRAPPRSAGSGAAGHALYVAPSGAARLWTRAGDREPSLSRRRCTRRSGAHAAGVSARADKASAPVDREGGTRSATRRGTRPAPAPEGVVHPGNARPVQIMITGRRSAG